MSLNDNWCMVNDREKIMYEIWRIVSGDWISSFQSRNLVWALLRYSLCFASYFRLVSRHHFYTWPVWWSFFSPWVPLDLSIQLQERDLLAPGLHKVWCAQPLRGAHETVDVLSSSTTVALDKSGEWDRRGMWDKWRRGKEWIDRKEVKEPRRRRDWFGQLGDDCWWRPLIDRWIQRQLPAPISPQPNPPQISLWLLLNCLLP